MFRYALLASLLISTPVSAQLYGFDTIPIGTLQDGPTPFCLSLSDTQRQMSAVIGGRGQASWDKLAKEERCGIWQNDYMVYHLISTGWYFRGHRKFPIYLVELKLHIAEQLVSVFAFVEEKPRGIYGV